MIGEGRNSHSQEVWGLQVAAWKIVGGVLLFLLSLASRIETGSTAYTVSTQAVHIVDQHIVLSQVTTNSGETRKTFLWKFMIESTWETLTWVGE
jgi:hypothetical protein